MGAAEAAQIFVPPADAWLNASPSTLTAGALVLVLALLAMGWILLPLLSRSSSARFFATGMVLALLPVCATYPSDRLLTFSGLGAFGLVGALIEEAFAKPNGSPASLPVRGLALAFVAVHAVLAPVLFPVRARAIASYFHTYLDRTNDSLPASSLEFSRKTLVLVNTPEVLGPMQSMILRNLRGEYHAKRLRLLAIAIEGNTGSLTRIDDRSVAITLRDGFVRDPMSQLFRNVERPFKVGERVDVAGMSVEVLEVVDDGRPKRVRFIFDGVVDGPDFVWMSWDRTRYVPFVLPPPGTSVSIPTIDFLLALGARSS